MTTATKTRPTDEVTEEEWHGFLGTTPDGERVFVSLTLTTMKRPKKWGGEPVPGWQTTDHREVHTVTRLSVSGLYAEKDRPRTAAGGGQCVDLAASITDESTAADRNHRLRPLEASDRAALIAMWRQHHLNDMQAGCQHQKVLGGTIGERLKRTEPCDHEDGGGYRYGSAWLVQPLDPHVVTRAGQIGRALDGSKLRG